MSNETKTVTLTVAPASVPGVSEGTTPVASVAKGNPPGEVPRLASDPHAAVSSVIRAGGDKGGRPRDDGLVPGSPEAKAADREKNRLAKQKQRERERERRAVTETPPALPSGLPDGPAATKAPSFDLPPVVEAGGWTAADFKQVIFDSLSFAEAARVKNRTAKAIRGGLSPVVAEQIGNSFAFPVETKTSLSTSSPEGIAKLFNALRVPLSVKPVITSCPALVYLIVRDAQLNEKLDKMIADVAEEKRRSEAANSKP